MYVSVIIPTHNRGASVGKLIACLQAQDFPQDKYEIIVVDNGSADNTREIVMEYISKSTTNVEYIFEPRIGAHNARHTGAKKARGEIIAFIDDDELCGSDWLRSMCDPYSDQAVGCVGGRVLPVWATQPPAWIIKFLLLLGTIDLGDDLVDVERPCLGGGNLSIRRSLFYEAGGFNPDAIGDRLLNDRKLIWYRGDGENGLQEKILQLGKKLVYAPGALAWHLIPAARMTVKYMRNRYFIEGISASYTAYRRKKYGGGKLLLMSFYDRCVSLLFFILSFLYTPFKAGRYYKYYFRSSFFSARSQHEIRLVFSAELRRHVIGNSRI